VDIVFIKGLTVETIIGVFDWERNTPQPLVIDLEMQHDISKAAASDELAEALNYKAVSDRIIEHVQESRCELIETLAEQLALLVQQEFAVTWLKLTLGKPAAIPAAETVGLIIERGNKTG
jgi:dihydroneopterin aldolase